MDGIVAYILAKKKGGGGGGGAGIEAIEVYIVDYFEDTVTLTKGCIIPSERAIYT